MLDQTSHDQFKPDWDAMAVMVEEQQRMAKRIEDLETEQDCVGWFGYDTGVRAWFETNKGDDDSIPLYKAPRQWVGLTDDEIKSLPSWWPSYEDAPALIELVKDVEAKLREKNGE
jgi:hypothetical protein